MQKSDDVTNEEHVSFYKSFLNDWEDHFKIEDLSIGMTMNGMINNLGTIVKSNILKFIQSHEKR
eukprot:15634465-Heterocapsa_arctica.AAC.1